MARIQVRQFQGIAPRLDARMLSESQGQIGENLRLTSLSLQSWRESILVNTPALVTPSLSTIYLYQGTGADRWLTWSTDVDIVKAPISNDTTSRIYFTGGTAFKPQMSDNANDTVTGVDGPGGTGIYPENSVSLGIPAPTTAPTVAVGIAGATPIAHIYVYTFVSQFGEESALSPASALINIDTTDAAFQCNLSAMQTSYAAEYNTINKIRIYRSVSGVNAAAYQFVAEITPSATYSDTNIDAVLGEVVSTTDYDLPPTNMFGLLDASNGILVGFTDYEVCFSEPYQPHAWPIKYRLAVVSKIIGGGLFGNTIVVCTDDQPVLIVGNHPSTMTMTIHPDHQACVAKQGIVSMKGRVVYPSPDGLYSIGYGGGQLLTESLYDRETWQERDPSQLRSTNWDTRYIGFTDSKGIVIEMANNTISCSDFNIDVDAIYSDSQNDRLYVSQIDPDTLANVIYEFNSAGIRQPYRWKSKKFSIGSQATITAGKILAQYGELLTASEIAALQVLAAQQAADNVTAIGTGNIHGALNAHILNGKEVNGSDLIDLSTPPTAQNIVINLYGDGNLIDTATVIDDRPFRFKSGGRYRQYEIEIQTFTDVNEITIASSVSDLL